MGESVKGTITVTLELDPDARFGPMAGEWVLPRKQRTDGIWADLSPNEPQEVLRTFRLKLAGADDDCIVLAAGFFYARDFRVVPGPEKMPPPIGRPR